MKITLHDSTYGQDHTIILIPRNDEIVLATEEGKEIVSLSVSTMTREGDKEKKESVPTKNFWINFDAVERSSMKNTAEAWVEIP